MRVLIELICIFMTNLFGLLFEEDVVNGYIQCHQVSNKRYYRVR